MYKEPNPEKKKEINNFLGRNIKYNQGKAILLDHNFNTTKSILEHFQVGDIIVPENCDDAFESSKDDEVYGQCMINGDFLETLKQQNPEHLSLIYSDFMGQYNTCVAPLLEYLKTIQLKKGTILGMTWSVNGDKQNSHKHSEELTKFACKYDWEKIEEPSQYCYDTHHNMNVIFYEKT